MPVRAPRLLLALLASATMLAISPASPASAQQGPGGLINPQRDCQTVLRCNFRRNGSYRGCISAYSCRVCRLVAARCAIGKFSGNCNRMQCSWGG